MTAKQMLPVTAYSEYGWFRDEMKTMLSSAWLFAGLESDLPVAGDYLTCRIGPASVFVLRKDDGALVAFHNLCRHRGTELLEGRGTVGRTIVCPYHKWSYERNGTLRGIPNEKDCFPDLNKSCLSLLPASVDVFNGALFVHPEPDQSLKSWLNTVTELPWPTCDDYRHEAPAVVYDLRCNWKVYVENSLDGYHLAHLHKETLGGPPPTKNVWEQHGRHMLWYSTETGEKTCLPNGVVEQMVVDGMISGSEDLSFPGVYYLYPFTFVVPGPGYISISTIEPVSAETSRLHVRSWTADARFPADDLPVQNISLNQIDTHPKESGDFTLEDIWICEKLQRSMQSPYFSVGAMAQGNGAEEPLSWFQQQILTDLQEK